MRRVKGFNYDTEKHKEIIAHIDSQPNGSQYIWSLVEKDMNSNSIEEIVKQQIEKYLEGVEIRKEKSESIDTDEVLNILQL